MTVKYNKEKGFWEAYYSARHPITRQPITLRRVAETEAAARKLERELIRRIQERLIEEASPSWRKVVAEYLEDCRARDLTEHSIHDYQTGLERYTFGPWSNKRINEITTQNIWDLIKTGPVAEKSRAHQKNVFKFIRAVFGYAVQRAYIQRNPCPVIKFKLGEKVKRVLTEEEVRRFLHQAKEMGVEWYPIWAGALYTGMRNGELYALTWDKVNMEDRLITVSTSWSMKDGFKCTKSGHDRLVEIAAPFMEVLRELKLKSAGSPYVFPRLDKWDTGDQARELRMFLLGMGLPSIRFHDLRATWATILLSKGVEPIRLMKAGGWRDMKTMMCYVRLAGVDIRGMTDDLNLHDPHRASGRVVPLKRQGSGNQE
jgi:integrase